MKYLLDGEETKRLKFRLLYQTDFDDWLEFFTNYNSSGLIGMQDIDSPYDQCQEWFKRVMDRYKNNLGGLNVLIDKTTNEFIGQCGLLIQEVDGLTELEIGYSIIPRFWNKGYATEAAIKCRDYAFENDFADTLISIIHIDNVKSEKVALKNGMIKTKQTEFKKMPVHIFRINKQDWMQYKTDNQEKGDK
jgi:[ribosomal protein S5]-alanine N-acetyltransferase